MDLGVKHVYYLKKPLNLQPPNARAYGMKITR